MKTDHQSSIPENHPLIRAGLEIGTSKICVAVSEVLKDGSLQLLSLAEVPSEGVRKGEIIDAPAAVYSVRRALDLADEKTGIPLRGVRVAYSGSPHRIHRTIDCLHTLELRIEGIVPSPVASAHGILQSAIDRPTLLIDLGGGTTDYCLLDPHGIRSHHTLPIGGDHLTCDLSIGLKIPMAEAEDLKISEGSALPSGGDSGKEPDRPLMQRIIYLRVREIFEQIRDRIATSAPGQSYSQILLTGGSSRLHGISPVAEEVFGVRVMPAPAISMMGDPLLLENPAYSTAIGLMHVGLERTAKKEVSEEDLDIPPFLRNGLCRPRNFC